MILSGFSPNQQSMYGVRKQVRVIRVTGIVNDPWYTIKNPLGKKYVLGVRDLHGVRVLGVFKRERTKKPRA